VQLIGERGVTLSGGQAARVCLARALYRDAEILIIECVLCLASVTHPRSDALSALDARTASAVFERAIVPQRGRKTLLVVTHALHLLSRFDRVLFLGASGRITADGTFDALVQADSDFTRLVHDQQAGAGRARADQADDADSDSQPAKALMLDDYATTGTVQLSSAVVVFGPAD